ncbi:thiamine transporter [Scopulibacillus daqui]|uniref:Thiamine transporter n=1 Tax=Scopulibacillus daqui TaxID=1469162 RepID=A0ABS2PXU3_9BACL|nr:energy-coupled thiamine transporter ThiT [Scopulibacillus daqui]MBM7644314.1 thiamine transporter [Scopulibacillus daqui]
MQKTQIRIMTETALMTAISVVLSFIQIRGPWAAGGSISLEMVPLIILSFRRGVKWGMAAGVIYGLINFMFNPYYVHPVQLILDYPLAFGLLGLSGIFILKESETKVLALIKLIAGVTIGCFARFVSHFASAMIFFGSSAPKGQPVALYAFIYNISYIGPSYIIALFVLILMFLTAPLLIRRQR